MHIFNDIRSSDELLLYIQLRDGGPVGVLFDGFSEIFILQHVNIFEFFNAIKFEDLGDVVAKAAPRHFLVALHKKYDVIFLDPLSNLLV